MTAPIIITLNAITIQNDSPVPPSNMPLMTASTSRVMVSVTAVAPTAMLTLLSRETPRRRTIG